MRYILLIGMILLMLGCEKAYSETKNIDDACEYVSTLEDGTKLYNCLITNPYDYVTNVTLTIGGEEE